MGKPAIITLKDQEKETMSPWVHSGTWQHRFVERAKIILGAAEGQNTKMIAQRLNTPPAGVTKWDIRFSC